MLVKWSVQQDFELVSSVLVQFATRTGRRKGNPKGVDETPHGTQAHGLLYILAIRPCMKNFD